MKGDLQPTAPSAEQPQGYTDSPYLLSDEAAGYLKFRTARLFREWAKRNRVPTLHRGRTLLYDRRVLDAFLKQKPWTRVHRQSVAPLRVVRKVKPVDGNEVAR